METRKNAPYRCNIERAILGSGKITVDDQGRIWRKGKRAESTSGKHQVVCHKIGGKPFRAMARRLVWVALRGEIPRGMVVRHKNGDAADNRPENLELGRKPGMRRRIPQSQKEKETIDHYAAKRKVRPVHAKRPTVPIHPLPPAQTSQQASIVLTMLTEYFGDDRAAIEFMRAHAGASIMVPIMPMIERLALEHQIVRAIKRDPSKASAQCLADLHNVPRKYISTVARRELAACGCLV